METEQPILDLTENQQPENLIPNNYTEAELDFSAYSLNLGF